MVLSHSRHESQIIHTHTHENRERVKVVLHAFGAVNHLGKAVDRVRLVYPREACYTLAKSIVHYSV
jgi:hypothetical protein